MVSIPKGRIAVKERARQVPVSIDSIPKDEACFLCGCRQLLSVSTLSSLMWDCGAQLREPCEMAKDLYYCQ